MADCLNNEEQINSNLSESNVDALTSNLDGVSSVTSEMSGESSISSTMYSANVTTSNLGSEEPLNSELDLPTTYTYKGSETDNIVVTVDNKGFIISASVKQIKFNSFSDFPKTGSEHLIYIDATNKTLYGWDSNVGEYYKLVADVKVPTKLSEFINDGNGTEGSRFATVQQVSIKKTVYTGITGSEFSMNPDGIAVVQVENFPYTTFSSIPNGTVLEVTFMNPYVSAIDEYPLYLEINGMSALRVLVTEGKSDGYYNPVTMGGWKANDVLTFVKGRSWMLTMISGKLVNGVVQNANYAQRAYKDSEGNTISLYYAKETDVSAIRQQYLKSATVMNDMLTITKQDGSTVEFKGGSGSGTKIIWREWE